MMYSGKKLVSEKNHVHINCSSINDNGMKNEGTHDAQNRLCQVEFKFGWRYLHSM